MSEERRVDRVSNESEDRRTYGPDGEVIEEYPRSDTNPQRRVDEIVEEWHGKATGGSESGGKATGGSESGGSESGAGEREAMREPEYSLDTDPRVGAWGTGDIRDPDEIAADVITARVAITRAMLSMPYSGSLGPPPLPRDDYSEDEWLDEIAAWLTALAGVLRAVAETNSELHSELFALRGQRKAIREFLGTHRKPVTPPNPFDKHTYDDERDDPRDYDRVTE